MKRVFFIFLITAVAPGLAFAGKESKEAEYKRLREKMVSEQIEKRGIDDPVVLEAMRRTPRHMFVPESSRDMAYDDRPLPIGEGQTISQPYVVALMTQSLGLSKGDRVLEIGTGSGYQAAVLSEITDHVYTIEIKKRLYERASENLERAGYEKVSTRFGDGYAGWEEAAPFDAIIATASMDHIPPPLLAQLKEGGKLIFPLGKPFGYQQLTLVTKRGKDYKSEQITGVLFVPMTGKALGEDG